MRAKNKMVPAISCRWLISVASLVLLQHSTQVCADDYKLNPHALHGGFEEYATPADPEVCNLYLKNLRYFARRNVPMSCDRPIAPHLRDQIKKVEWENLDPAQYPELFRQVAAELPSAKATTEKELAWIEEAVKRRDFAFRRAKLDLSGEPERYDGPKVVKAVSGKFYIVQYGDDVTETQLRTEILRCKPVRGNPPGTVPSANLRLYMVTSDMKEMIDTLRSLGFGWHGENLLTINGRPYVEGLGADDSINLLQVNLQKPVFLEPVCNFTFHKSPERK